jgi:hypothetical protein
MLLASSLKPKIEGADQRKPTTEVEDYRNPKQDNNKETHSTRRKTRD